MNQYLPEEITTAPRAAFTNRQQLKDCGHALYSGRVKKCDRNYNLIVDLGGLEGILPFAESAIGADCGKVKEISVISRVGKQIVFCIKSPSYWQDDKEYVLLSRKDAQMEGVHFYHDSLMPGDIIPAVVTHFEPFGAFVDIGCGIISLIPIDSISVSRISSPADRFRLAQQIRVIVTGRDDMGRITLSHKELLGTWQQNAGLFHAGETVFGIVRSIESYGIFVELRPNLTGLAEYKSGYNTGDRVSVFIKSILPDKMKIKLILIDKLEPCEEEGEETYFVSEDHISSFHYSPPDCGKQISRIF